MSDALLATTLGRARLAHLSPWRLRHGSSVQRRHHRSFLLAHLLSRRAAVVAAVTATAAPLAPTTDRRLRNLLQLHLHALKGTSV